MEETQRIHEGKKERRGEGKSRQESSESKGHSGGDVEGKEWGAVIY